MSDFEEATIIYNAARLKRTLSDIRHVLTSKARKSKLLLHSQPTSSVINLVQQALTQGTDIEDSLADIIRLAYHSAQMPSARNFLIETFGNTIGDKVWRLIHFLARPISACRLLGETARRLPAFRKLKIQAHRPPIPVILDNRYLIPIHEAWERLGLPVATPSTRETLNKFNDKFIKACSKPFSTHAEIQLVLKYLENPHSQPSLHYLGCSKKACLLCESFMQKSPLQFKTRGGHGKCYPTWSIAHSHLKSLEELLAGFAKTLVQRIMESDDASRRLLGQPLAESSMVSSLGSSLLQDFELRKHLLNDQKQRSDTFRTQFYLQFVFIPQTNRPLDFCLRLLRNDPSLIIPKRSKTASSCYVNELSDCVMCGLNTGRLCTRGCQSSRYCSNECQVADWPSHKLLCKKYAKKSPRPSDNHKLAIEFPQDRSYPSLIWVYCEKRLDDCNRPWEYARVGSFLGRDNPIPERKLIQRNRRRDQLLPNTIEAVFRDTFLIDSSKPNRSLYRSLGSSGTTSCDWRGPGIILRKRGISSDPGFYGDISLADYRHVLDYFLSYRDDHVKEIEKGLQIDKSRHTISGVKVTCFGTQKLNGAGPFVHVSVGPTHVARGASFPECEISPISCSVGLPVRVWKMPSNDEWIHRPDWYFSTYPDSNPTACKLFMNPNIDSPWWGWAPLCWQCGIGDVLLIRADDNDLSVDDAELLCRFCEWKLQPMFEDALGAGWVQRSKQEVVDFITRENMEKFREELMSRGQDSVKSYKSEGKIL